MIPAGSLPASLALTFLLLLLLLLTITSSHAQSSGDPCRVDGGAGICKLLPQCQVVYNALLSGTPPKELCGFSGFEPIVCCPDGSNQRQTPATTTTTTIRPWTTGPVTAGPFNGGSRPGSVARAKCAEYAQAVYGLEIPPTLSGHRTPVNVSRCAIKTRKLIVGGTLADPKEFPHMAAVGYNTNNGIAWLCGGSLISEKHVLTAAHCSYSLDWGKAAWVRLGDLNLRRSDDEAKPVNIRISEIKRYPQYRTGSGYHDIALLKLERNVEFSAWIRPACLPYKYPELGPDNKALATGWGRVDWSDEEGSDDLLKVTLKYASTQQCNESFIDGSDGRLRFGIVEDWQICAGEVGKDTCQGDSGGPLAIFNDDHSCMYSIIGVTSLGRLCGSIIPGVYTRVYHYLSWIEREAWPEYM